MSDEFRASLYSFNLTQKRAKRPAGAPDAKLALPVTKVGVVGAGLMAAQLAVLFARNLKVPVVLTEVDQDRLDKGLAGIRREFANAGEEGPALRRRGEPAVRAGQRIAGLRRLRRCRLRDRGGVRGDLGEEAGVRRAGEARPAGLCHRQQHLRAVGHRDGRRPRAPRAGRRLPLLQPGGADAAGRGSSHGAVVRCRRWRRRSRWPSSSKDPDPGRRQPRLRGQPAADAGDGRGVRHHRRGHPVNRGGRVAGPARACR